MKFQNILQVPDLALLVYMKYCAQCDFIKLFVLSRGIRAVILSAMKLWSFPLKLISPKTNITDTELKDVLSSSILFKFTEMQRIN